jgi:hypothetical protein
MRSLPTPAGVNLRSSSPRRWTCSATGWVALPRPPARHRLIFTFRCQREAPQILHSIIGPFDKARSRRLSSSVAQ